MTDFTKQYVELLMLQYYNQPKAVAEIETDASLTERTKDAADHLIEQYDLDVATGDALDKIGKLVGIRREDPILNDDELYRFFIRLKIAQNTSSATLFDENGNGLQDVIRFAFDNQAYVVDNKDMSLDLYVPDDFSIEVLTLIFRLNLLPKPQGVRYNNIKQIATEPAFGFSNNPLSRAFASKNNPEYVNGGPFARKVIFNF